MLRVLAPAKVNLHLSVDNVRPDGYHDLTAVFHALELADEIVIEPAPALSLTCDFDLGVHPEHNLAYRAAVATGIALEKQPLVHIRLIKHIPHGAGLGGGSSDAAAVVAGLATLWGVDPGDPRCVEAAKSVGADVPFFLAPAGAALMTGRGDHFEHPLPALEGVPVVLVSPPDPVSTAAAFVAFDADPVAPGAPDAVVAALDAHDAHALGRSLFNNLEQASFSVVPEVADALAWVRSAPHVMGAAVSGSGSAVFALCEDRQAAQAVAHAATERGWWSLVTALGSHGARVVVA